MRGDKETIVEKPSVLYKDLTSSLVDELDPKRAEEVLIGLIAELARVKEGGVILSWDEFNGNPDPLINKLLSRMLVGQVDKRLLNGCKSENVAVMSVEASASYLSGTVAEELEEVFTFGRPPRIIRARKLAEGEKPSPAMGERIELVRVSPITAGGEMRTLVASVGSDGDLDGVEALFLIDDFKATGETLKGAIAMAKRLFPNVKVIIPMAGLSKPDQETADVLYQTNGIVETITALDVRFWPDKETGLALIQTNGFPPYRMHRAKADDFN